MFVPVETAFLEALKSDTSLWDFAYKNGIVMVSPTNLLAVLKIVEQMWKVENQTKNARDIADRAGAIYDKFVSFLKNFEEIGKTLTSAKDAYENGFKQLSTGKGNLAWQIQGLKDLHANTKSNIPDKFLPNNYL